MPYPDTTDPSGRMFETPDDPSPTPVDRRALRAVAVVGTLVIALLVAGFSIRVDYAALGPGPTTNMLDRIKATGVTVYPSKGRLLLTTVSVISGPISVVELMRSWSAREQLVPNVFIQQPCATEAEEIGRNIRDIEESKQKAQLAAFQFLKLAAEKLPAARVLYVYPGAPADGKLRRGDVFVAVDGKSTPTGDAARKVLADRKIGDGVRVTVRRDGKNVTVSLRTASSGQVRPECPKPYPVIGVSLGNDYRFQHRLDIDTADVGGPSGGLVFALSVIDSFVREDLTRGHVIAATGEIDFDERGIAVVKPIGGVRQKVASALRAGADVFLVPAGEAVEARAVAPESLRVFGVDTLRDALDALRTLPVRT